MDNLILYLKLRNLNSYVLCVAKSEKRGNLDPFCIFVCSIYTIHRIQTPTIKQRTTISSIIALLETRFIGVLVC